MFLRKKNTIHYYKSCSELPYYNFYKVLETQNYAYLIDGWDEKEDVLFDVNKAKKYWKEIFNEYAVLKDDNAILKHIEITAELMYFETRREIVSRLIEIISYGRLDKNGLKKYADELRKWNYKINLNQPLNKEIERLLRQLKQSSNKIRLLRNELENLMPEREKVSLLKQIVKMEQALQRNEINPRKISVEKWIYMVEEIKEMATLRRKAS